MPDKKRARKREIDSIEKFAAAHFIAIPPKTIKPYLELYDKALENIGEQVLVIEQSTHSTEPRYQFPGARGIVAPRHEREPFCITSEKRLGILTGSLEFNVKSGNLIVPTEKHAVKKRFASSWTLVDGAISVKQLYLENLGRALKRGNVRYEHDTGLQFYFCGEVEEHFRKPAGLFEGLNLSDEEIEGMMKLGAKVIDDSYAQALMLLGQKVPRNFDEKYVQEATRKAVSMLHELQDLISKEERIAGRIDGFRREARGEYIWDDDGERYHKHRLSAFLKPYQRGLKEKQDEIRAKLQEAVNMGIPQLGIKAKIGGTKPFNLSHQFKLYCGAYEVEVPAGTSKGRK